MQEKEFTKEDAKKELENGYSKAEEILENPDKMERFLQRLEKKLKVIPIAGKTLSMIPTLISLVKSYIQKDYTDIPIGTIIATISALLYWLSPADAIPDVIPGVGYVDDTLVIGTCLKLIHDDLKEYEKWREENHKIIEN